MAATKKKQIQWYGATDGTSPQTRTVKIAASQGIWMPGAPVYQSQAGTVKLSDTADGTGDAWHGFLRGTITAEAAANTEFRMTVIRPQDVWVVYLENDGTDLAESQALVGDQYGLTVSTTAGEIGYTTLDTNNSNTVVKVVDIMSNVDPEKFDTSTAPGAALVQFLPANIDLARA